MSVLLLADGNPNEEDFCGRALRPNNTRGRQELLRAVRAGEYSINVNPSEALLSAAFYSLTNLHIVLFCLFLPVSLSSKLHACP
jgi:hypothetical protein